MASASNTFSIGSSGSRSPTKRPNKATTDRILALHKIHLNRNLPKPLDLQALYTRVCNLRVGEHTPMSKAIAPKVKELPNLSEARAKQVLGVHLGYRGEDEDLREPGEQHIDRTPELDWTPRCVPNGLVEDKEFRNYLRTTTKASTPRPDFTYGYSSSPFDETQKRRLDLLLDAYCVTANQQPWFPYWICEWKSSASGRTIEEAETQVRRAGAAAVNALHDFYISTGAAAMSDLVSRSAMFSMCVDSNMIEFFVHWRGSVHESGGANFEADCLGKFWLTEAGDVYAARSIIYNILAWARTERLMDIKALLSAKSRGGRPDDNTAPTITTGTTSISTIDTTHQQERSPPPSTANGINDDVSAWREHKRKRSNGRDARPS